MIRHTFDNEIFRRFGILYAYVVIWTFYIWYLSGEEIISVALIFWDILISKIIALKYDEYWKIYHCRWPKCCWSQIRTISSICIFQEVSCQWSKFCLRSLILMEHPWKAFLRTIWAVESLSFLQGRKLNGWWVWKFCLRSLMIRATCADEILWVFLFSNEPFFIWEN